MPLADIEHVACTPLDEVMRPEGIRLPGGYLSKVIASGAYWWRKRQSFWSVR